MSIKVELIHNDGIKINLIFHYKSLTETFMERRGFIQVPVEKLQFDFRAWADFPTSEKLEKVLSKQTVFEKLYLNAYGDILSIIRFTKE